MEKKITGKESLELEKNISGKEVSGKERRKQILELIRQLNREEKITIVLITHYMDETVHADRLVVMKNGFVLREGKPQEIFFDRELLAQAGLIAPFAAQLSMDLAAAGIAVKPELDAETLAEEVCQLK